VKKSVAPKFGKSCKIESWHVKLVANHYKQFGQFLAAISFYPGFLEAIQFGCFSTDIILLSHLTTVFQFDYQ